MDDLKQIDRMQHLKPQDKLKIAFELYDFARSRISSEIKRNNPNISNEELLKKVNKRFISIK